MSKAKRALKALGRSVLLVVLSLVIGITAYSWNARVLTGNAMPMPFGWGLSVVLSGSMEPTLSVNDLVIVHEQDAYEPGDIVVYQNGSMLVLHRIISMADGEVITQGDANNTSDPPVTVSDIKGKAVAQAPGLGAAIHFFKTPVGTGLLIAAAIVLFELPYLQRRKQSEAEKEKIKEEIRRLKGE